MAADKHPFRLTATEAAARIATGSLTSLELVESCLARIDAREPAVHAWAAVDAEAARAAARRADAMAPVGPLHGVPVGLKDVIDTADLPTAYGSEAYAGHQPALDAVCVQQLKRAGAIILGKVVTAEFATYRPGPTANPLNPGHTPGGSSSGSAAAVADFHVPLTLGTQTAGSVIRPASFCGVYGFKPTHNRYPTAGVLDTAAHLDTIGTFARSIDDLMLLDTVLAVPTAAGPSSTLRSIGICRSPQWAEASSAMQAALEAAAERLRAAGHKVVDVILPAIFDGLADAQAVIHKHEAWQHMGTIRRDHDAQVSEAFKAFIDAGAAVALADYAAARNVQDACKAALAQVFAEADVLLTPGAPGIAPEGLGATGNPTFNRMWTAVGTPCVGIPAAIDASGLPLGLQFVGPLQSDRALLAFAKAVAPAIDVRAALEQQSLQAA